VRAEKKTVSSESSVWTAASAVDADAITLPVRRLLRTQTAHILGWEYTELGVGIGNPVSLNVYRFRGTAKVGGVTVTWSLILKMAQSPANVGFVDFGEGPDQSHWNYWRRELLLFESGLLEALPGGLAAPRFYGGHELPGNVIWMWLEDVSRPHAAWSPERCKLAAYHLGCFNGAYLSGTPMPVQPWLARQCARQFVEMSHGAISMIGQHLPEIREDPVVRFLENSDSVLDALERIPHTFCHFDAGTYNLMSRRTGTAQEETVAIDWALAGVGPVGAELSQLVASDHSTRYVGLPPNETELLDSYVTGLGEAGWRGDRDIVVFGYSAYMIFRLGGFLLSILQMELESGQAVTLTDTSISGLLPFIERVQKMMPRFAWARG
jgi:Phosphotransferase enzyme family